MGEFNAKIVAEFTPPKTWKLEEPLSFECSLTNPEINLLSIIGASIEDTGKGTGKVSCEKGMITDLASTPRILWNLIAPWDVARAAIIHDHLYAALRGYYSERDTNENWSYITWKNGKELADKIFLMGMKSADPKVPCWKIYPAYWAVHLFGRKPASTG
tara:strand:+ start:721 stop:1197 length:477 start_codon:yes stop_codon:yes gene_type:complete